MRHWLALAPVVIVTAVPLLADDVPTLRAASLPVGLRVDGFLDEPAWEQAAATDALLTTEPVERGTPTGRTLVRVLAGPRGLAFGIWCQDPEPERIVTFTKERDGALESEDHVKLVLGSFDPGAAFEEYLKKTSLAGLWVVEQEGPVLGMAGLLMDGNEAEVEPIVVRSDHRSQGNGNLLLGRLKVEAKARGVGYLNIKPVARNVEAIQCFHRAGFSLLGHIDMFRELSGEKDQVWKESVTIHGHEFRY